MVMINSLGSEAPPRRIGGAGPPPPVPPRPSKSVVAEALAKTRLYKETISRSPTRKAPPPPVPHQEKGISKSHSSYTVNVNLKKSTTLERSISEELKNYPRPVVYQSNNSKNKNSANVQDGNSDVDKSGNTEKKIGRFGEIVNSVCETIDDNNYSVEVSRKKSTIRGSYCENKFFEEIKGEQDSEGHITFTNDQVEEEKSFSPTLERKLIVSVKDDPSRTIDSKCWDPPSKDRNHVNTLIEEMFASVLEVQTDVEPNNNNNNLCKVSLDDTTQIVIGSEKSDDEVVIVSVDPVQVENFPKTVILITNEDSDYKNKSIDSGKQVKFDDQTNHEQLISELECMKKDQEKILKRQRKPSKDIYVEEDSVNDKDNCLGDSLKIQRPNRLDLGKVELERKTSFSTRKEENKQTSTPCERIPTMSSIHGLPPLPKSLSGFNLPEQNSLTRHYSNVQQSQLPPTPMRTSSKMRQPQQQSITPSHPRKSTPTALDAKLALLRQEMYSLRQLDLSLLGKLWSLNESIQDFRQLLMLQDEHREVLSPPSPSPSSPAASSADDDDGDFYMSALSLDYRPAPPPPPTVSTVPRVPRRPSCSSEASSR